MSEWFPITEKEDVKLSEDSKYVEILFGRNEFGNQYVEVPVEFILRLVDNQP